MLKAIVDAEGKLTVEGEDKAIDALLGPGVAPRGPGITEVSLQLHSVEEASQVLTGMNSKHGMLLDLRPAAGSVAPLVLLQTGTSISEIGDLITNTMPGSALPKLLSDAVPAAAQSQSSNAAVESVPQSQESTPKPPAAAADQRGSTKRVSTADIGLSPVPPVPELIWKSLSPADKQTTAKQLVERAVEFATNRQVAAAWAPLSEGTALLAHLDAATRQDIALQILQQREQLTAEHVRAAQIGNDFQQERVRLMKEAVNTTQETTRHLVEWRKLSHRVVPLLIATTMFASLLVLVALDLVRQDKLNGIEMALVAFVFSLMAISPATLLLLGRPLEGLDKWRPGAKDTESEEPATSAPPAGKKPAEKPGEKAA